MPLPYAIGREHGGIEEVIAASESQPETVARMVAEAKERIESLSVERAAAEIEGGDVLLVDVREEDERILEGAIATSMHVPRRMLELSADPASPLHRGEFEPSRRIVLYCSSGSRSALAADTLRRMGYGNVAHLDGGMMAWRWDEHPVEAVDVG
jgi:rhodanese-related sulfurtransferase